jgi:FAD:protein FMN transferase
MTTGPQPHVSTYHGLLGTVVEIRIESDDERAAMAAERRVVDEIQRLERVFSVYDPGSALVRWRRGAIDDPGDELAGLLARALDWQWRSDGAFNPLTGLVTARWRAAESAGVAPTGAELHEIAASIQAPRYEAVDGAVRRLAACDGLDLNAFAKGHIVDRAIGAAWHAGTIDSIVVNAGGDLAHRGRGTVKVGIENPRRPFDNEPPLAVVEVANAAVATTGGARRGFVVDGVRHSHVLDPRSARPVTHVLSATVLAPDTATADVVATVVGVLPVDAGLAFVDELDGVGCLLVPAAGDVTASCGWPGGQTVR